MWWSESENACVMTSGDNDDCGVVVVVAEVHASDGVADDDGDFMLSFD